MKSIPYGEHFRLTGHAFTKHAKFIIIEALDKTTDTITIRKILKEHEDYWISRLKTLSQWIQRPIQRKYTQVCIEFASTSRRRMQTDI